MPSAIRSSLSSRPWSAEFLNKCWRGSPISSITVRSSSVSSPVIWSSIFLLSFLLKSLIIRGKRFTTFSIGTILTFITDSCRLVVTLSRYSICSLNAASLLVSSSVEFIDTSPFLAIISSLTRFIRTSSFSISTRTVRPTAGFAVDFLAAGCAASAGLAAALAAAGCAAGFGFSASLGSSLTGSGSGFTSGSVASKTISNGPTIASLTSETFSTAALTLSRLSFVKYTRLKSISNFSSSISCTSGTAFITSPSSSNALNTRNALAALSIHDSWRYTVTPKIFWFCAFAFSNVFFSKSVICMLPYFAPPSGTLPSGAGAAATSAGFSPLVFPVAASAMLLRVLIISSLSSVPSSAVSSILAR